MAKPTSYDLLKDTHAIVSAMEGKMDKRMGKIENRVDVLEDFKGKIMGMAIITSALITGGINWVWKKITA